MLDEHKNDQFHDRLTEKYVLKYPYELTENELNDSKLQWMKDYLNDKIDKHYIKHCHHKKWFIPVYNDNISKDMHKINDKIVQALYRNIYMKHIEIFNNESYNISINDIFIPYHGIIIKFLPRIHKYYNNEFMSIKIGNYIESLTMNKRKTIYSEFLLLYEYSMNYACNICIEYFTNLMKLSTQNDIIWKTFHIIWRKRNPIYEYIYTYSVQWMLFSNTLIKDNPDAYITFCEIYNECDILFSPLSYGLGYHILDMFVLGILDTLNISLTDPLEIMIYDIQKILRNDNHYETTELRDIIDKYLKKHVIENNNNIIIV